VIQGTSEANYCEPRPSPVDLLSWRSEATALDCRVRGQYKAIMSVVIGK